MKSIEMSASRELSGEELKEVNGGILPLVAGVAMGYAFMYGVAVGIEDAKK